MLDEPHGSAFLDRQPPEIRPLVTTARVVAVRTAVIRRYYRSPTICDNC
jgi:hypothetical protein